MRPSKQKIKLATLRVQSGSALIDTRFQLSVQSVESFLGALAPLPFQQESRDNRGLDNEEKSYDSESQPGTVPRGYIL